MRPADPQTARQLDQRERMTTIQRHWKELTPAERLAWGEYAAEYFVPEQKGKPLGGVGQNAYNKAQSMRLAWGGELGAEAPVLPPPPAAVALEGVAAPAGQFAFRILHGLEGVDGIEGNYGLEGVNGYRLELKMTPATPNGRKPCLPDLRRAGEMEPGSFFPLAASGSVYLLEAPRFAVAPGERYGVQVRLVTPDGIPGPPLLADLHRLEPVGEGDGGAGLADRFPAKAGGGAEGLVMGVAPGLGPRSPEHEPPSADVTHAKQRVPGPWDRGSP